MAEAVIVSGPRKGQFISIDENGFVLDPDAPSEEEIQMFAEGAQRFLELVTEIDEKLARMIAKFEAKGLLDAESG